MPNATSRDARAGFEIFRAHGRTISLAHLNFLLTVDGYRQVARRTFTHYQNLMNTGYNRYIPINRFEVGRASRQYVNESTRVRYGYLDANADIGIVFLHSSGMYEIRGTASRVGDTGAVVEFHRADFKPDRHILAARPRDLTVEIHFLDFHHVVNGRVVDILFFSDRAVVEIDYSRLSSIAPLVAAEELETDTIQFTLIGDEDDRRTIDDVNRQISYFFELLESVRALVNRSRGFGFQSYAPPPILNKLSIASPVGIEVVISPVLVGIIPWALLSVYLARNYVRDRVTYYDGSLKRNENTKFKEDARIRELERQERLEEIEFQREVRSRVLSALDNPELLDDAIDRAIEREISPPARALGQSGIHQIDVATTEVDGFEIEEITQGDAS